MTAVSAPDPMKVIPWRKAAKYTKRSVYLRRESTGEFLRVDSIGRRGPNLWVTLADGRTFLVDRDRRFYGHTAGGQS